MQSFYKAQPFWACHLPARMHSYRFQIEREVRIHIALHHPHIIQLLAAFEDPEHVYLVQVRRSCSWPASSLLVPACCTQSFAAGATNCAAWDSVHMQAASSCGRKELA
jgi:hypothetical protein